MNALPSNDGPMASDAPQSETLRSEHEPSLAKVKLRQEITHSIRSCDGEPFILVHDPVRSQFFRLGITDWQIAALFDGERTLRQVVGEADATIGKEKAPPADVSRLANWLVQNSFCLLYTSPSPRDKRQSRMPSSA